MSHDHDHNAPNTPLSPPLDTTSTLLSNLTSLLNTTSNTTTTSSSTQCTPEHFIVPLFDSLDPNKPNSFSTKNQQAHVFLGSCLLAIVTVWSLFALEWIGVRRAYRLSAAIQIVMGGYLLLWLFVLMYPTDLIALFAYSTSDLLQLQHLSIALLLLAAGWVEVCQSTGWLTHPQWNVVWSVCMLYVGLVFFAHEQHSYWATVQHISLGLAMVCGALLFGRVKEGLGDDLARETVRRSKRTTRRAVRGGNVTVSTYRTVPPEDDGSDSEDDESAPTAAAPTPAARMVDNNLVLAGMCYSCAAAILILFRDHSHGTHTGTRTHCQPAWPLTAGGYVLAVVAAAAVGLTLALYSRRCVCLSALCCPVDERYNVWLRALHVLLRIGGSGDRVKRAREKDGERDVEEGGAQHPQQHQQRRAEDLSMSAAAQMLAIVREKEEEESIASRRLKEIEKLFERKPAANIRQIDERWHQHPQEERKETPSSAGSSSSVNRQEVLHELSSDDEK